MESKTKPPMRKLRLPFLERLKGRGARASAITDASGDAFILFDKNLNIVGMNPLARSVFHLILGEDVIGGDVLSGAPGVKPDNKNNGRYEKYLNAIRKGKPFFADSIVIHSGLLDINLKAEAFKVGKGFGIIFSDLDALKKVEKMPYDSQKGLATNLKSAPDCIFIFDLKGTILHGSRAGERLTGYAWEEIKGKSLFEITLLAPELLPKVAQLLELSAAGQSTGPDEFELIKKGGSHVFVDISTCPIGRGEEAEVVAITHDITERKRAEEALRQSEDRYRAIVENSLDGIYQVDASGKFTFINESFANIFGYRREELLDKHFSSLLSLATFPKVKEMVEEVLSGKDVRDEVLVQHKDGHEVPVNFSATPLKDRGKVVGLAGILRDMTEHKRTDRALNESEEKYRALVEAAGRSGEGIIIVQDVGDVEAALVFVNDEFCQIVGYSREESLKMSARDLIPPDEFGAVHDRYRRRQKGEEVNSHYEVNLRRRDGTLIPTEVGIGTMIYRGRAATVVFLRDIAERKRMEQALRQSEERFRDVLDNSLDMIYRLNLQAGRYDYVSPSTEKILGYSPEEFVALTIEKGRALAHPDDLARLDENVIELIASKAGTSSSIEYRIRHKELGYRWVSDNRSVVYDDANNPVAVVGNLRDITERKDAEWELWRTRERLQLMFDSVQDGVCVTNLEGLITDVNPKGLEMYRDSAHGQLIGKSAFELIVPHERGKTVAEMQIVLEQGTTGLIEHNVVRADGSGFLAEMHVSLLKDISGNATGFVTVLRDITERKKAEEELKESEERYRALVDTAGLAGEGIMIVERVEGNKAVIAFVNDTFAGMLGYQREKMLGMAARDLFLPGDRIWLQDKNRRKRKGEALPSHYAVMALRKDGSMLPIEISMGAMRYQGKSATVVYVRDVTERKQAEETLRESEAQFRAIFDGAAIGVVLIDEYGHMLKINPALERILGYTLEELRGMVFTDYMHPDDATVDVGLFREMVRGKHDHYQVEKRYIRKDGQMVWGCVTLSAVRGLGGKLQFAIGMVEDITESKLALENLRKSEEHFRALTENALEAIAIIGKDGTIIYGNPGSHPPRGYRPEEVIDTNGISAVHPEDTPKVMKVFDELMQNPGNTVSMQVRVRHKDGSWHIVEAIARNLLEERAVKGIVVNYHDVTEREQAHEELLKHIKRVEALHSVAQLASQTLELEELLNTSLDKVIGVMEAEAGCVYLLDMVEKELVLKTSRGLSDGTISRLATIKLNENNVQKIKEWRGGSTPLLKIFEETGLNITAEVKEKEQIQSFAVAPFMMRGQLSGLIAVGNRSQREFDSGDIDLLRAVGNQIGISTQNAMLYEEVRALIRETIDAQERERERICLEVHDGVAQTLVSAFQYLQALEATAPDDTQTKQLLAKTTTQIRQAIQESRDVINSLQPATLSDLGLVSTLRQELKRLGQETGLKIDFKADAIRFPRDVEVGLYRIIHEAVFNARKHADTRQLRVKINSEDAGVRVEVRDWGKGFDQAYLARARKRGTGLFSIRKRAELLKGTCEIQSKPGEGTTVRVEIPFSAAEIGSG